MTNDMLIIPEGLATIALGIARDLKGMNRPSISIDQITTRVEDFFDDPALHIDARALALEIASHPAIRSAIRR
jgi:hypothetical protein